MEPNNLDHCLLNRLFPDFLNNLQPKDGDNENEDEESDEQIEHPLRNEVDETIKTLNRLILFTEDLGLDPLISNSIHIINQ